MVPTPGRTMRHLCSLEAGTRRIVSRNPDHASQTGHPAGWDRGAGRGGAATGVTHPSSGRLCRFVFGDEMEPVQVEGSFTPVSLRR